MTTKQIVAAALKLPLTKRADLASRLIRSLEEEEEKLSPQEHRDWWNKYWEHAGLMKLSSSDHAAEYFENLRIIDLYTGADGVAPG